jgi:Pentapeptide repeats (8 copies)/Pentapeptide repeats (9 copies)
VPCWRRLAVTPPNNLRRRNRVTQATLRRLNAPQYQSDQALLVNRGNGGEASAPSCGKGTPGRGRVPTLGLTRGWTRRVAGKRSSPVDTGLLNSGGRVRARAARSTLTRMARPRNERLVPPRLPVDLPSEPTLRLLAGADVTARTIRGDFSKSQLEGLVMEEVHIVNSSFLAADLNGVRMVDVLVEGSDFSGADMEEANLSRVTFKNCRMSGASLPRSQLRDLFFDEVRLDEVNLRRASGERLLFEHANLRRGDLYAAQLTSARFFDCDLKGADVSEANLRGARFHGSDLSELRGGEYLRDITIDSSQVLPLALRIFAGLDIRVEDDREVVDPN